MSTALPDAPFGYLLCGNTREEHGSGAQGVAPLRDKLVSMLATHDRAGTVRVSVDAVHGGQVDIDEVYTQVLAPLLVDAGTA